MVYKLMTAVLILFSGAFPASATLQSVSEDQVRSLTEKFGQTIVAGDLDTMRGFWNPQSPHLASRLRIYKALFATSRIEFIRVNVTRLEVTGDRAISHLTSDERYLDKKTGGVTFERDAYHGFCRSFEWIKTGAGWKIEREFLVQEEVAIKLDQLASENERLALFEEEKEFVTDTLEGSLITLGNRHLSREEYDAALHCYQLVQTVAERIGDQAGIAAAWMYMGIVNHARDDFEEAVLLEQKALALYEAAGLKRGAASVLEKLSRIYLSLEDLRQAFTCAEKSLRLSEEEKNRKKMADALADLAAVYGEQNNSQQHVLYMERAFSIAQELGDTFLIASLRTDLASAYQSGGQYERALEIYQQVLKQLEGFGDRIGAAQVRDAIGRVYASQGKYGDAINYHRQALTEYEVSNRKSDTAEVLNSLSHDFLAQGKPAEALPLAERSVSLSRQTGIQSDLWLALTSLGYSHLGLNHTSEARRALAEAVSIIEKLRTQTAGDAEERERYFESGLLAHQGMLSLMIRENQPLDALVFAERTKARVLLDVLQHGHVSIQKAMTMQEREQERRLKSELTRVNLQLARAQQSDDPDEKRLSELTPRLEKARLDYGAFQTSLYAARPELRTLRGEGPVITREELAALMPDSRSALLEYVVTNEAVDLFAVTKAANQAQAEVRILVLPVQPTDLAGQTETFRHQLAERDLAFGKSARALYDLLLKPVQTQLKGKTNIVIVPDGVLWDLPFQALQTAAHRSLIQDAAVSYAPSLTVLREMSRRRKEREVNNGAITLLAFGDPQPGRDATEPSGLRSVKRGPLPEAEQEVKALTEVYGAAHSKVYVGTEAREDRVKAEAGEAKVLHFATHAILNDAAPMYSRLLMSPGGSGEDGLLEAWELMQLDLKAELAVLSACETARGRFGAGEGVIGLTWALFVAGVPTTVVSQWPVEAASTRDLMVSFHRILNSKPNAGSTRPGKAEALRQAELRLMRNPETSHPFYWAGFVLVGDGS